MSRFLSSVAKHLLTALTVLVVPAALATCGADDSDEVTIRRVPEQYATIQDAVDAARSGDLVLVSPGEYHEAVRIDTEGIVLRGTDRNQVVLDGEDRLANGITVTADGVAIENLTARRYQQNGVLFDGATEPDGSRDPEAVYGSGTDALLGYRVSWVTAHNNGLYGVYSFASRGGLIEHVYVSGHPDSGIYVGQCKPCDVVVRDSVAEHNAIGYYGTNASGGVYVIESVFAHNRLGMTPNSQKMELLAPQVETVIAGNLVVDNADPDTPEIADGFFGGGIAIGGGISNTVVRNRVSGHSAFGIGVVRLGIFTPEGNTVEGNVLEDNALDLLYLPDATIDHSGANCFAGNTFRTSVPDAIEDLLTCPGVQTPVGPVTWEQPPPPEGIDYRDVPAPGEQPTMPDAATAPWARASTTPPAVDLASIRVPPR
ncbi:MAG: right-handed parallel beta-helix repeat-containing protein [Actinobacteria bacterium]|nr:right-handed parallel beta-helix repeat-containing protein [Actinomycetota bacterium]